RTGAAPSTATTTPRRLGSTPHPLPGGAGPAAYHDPARRTGQLAPDHPAVGCDHLLSPDPGSSTGPPCVGISIGGEGSAPPATPRRSRAPAALDPGRRVVGSLPCVSRFASAGSDGAGGSGGSGRRVRRSGPAAAWRIRGGAGRNSGCAVL